MLTIEIGIEERDGLTLHVRTHQSAVGVVMFKERDQRGADAHDLARGDVDIIDTVGRQHLEVLIMASRHAVGRDLAEFVGRGICLRDDKVVFFVGGQVERIRLHEWHDLNIFDLRALEGLDDIFVDDRAFCEDHITLAVLNVDTQHAANRRSSLNLSTRVTRRYGVSMKPY